MKVQVIASARCLGPLEQSISLVMGLNTGLRHWLACGPPPVPPAPACAAPPAPAGVAAPPAPACVASPPTLLEPACAEPPPSPLEALTALPPQAKGESPNDNSSEVRRSPACLESDVLDH